MVQVTKPAIHRPTTLFLHVLKILRKHNLTAPSHRPRCRQRDGLEAGGAEVLFGWRVALDLYPRMAARCRLI